MLKEGISELIVQRCVEEKDCKYKQPEEGKKCVW